MSGLRLGHHEALRQVFELTSPKIFGKLIALLKTPELARSALTTTYLRLWQNHASIPADGCDYMHFIAALAHRTAVDIRFSGASGGEIFNHTSRASGYGATHSDASVFEGLSEADRDMLTAAYLQFESVEQIANRAGLSIEETQRRLSELAFPKSGGAT
ncbi:RNA polymerase sigma factor [Henriciella marina]|uniref:RNA polymerase sigma factor n=1 Tax=Henriciella marina TaxID=453851 RepID=UPI000399EA93|nr:hypothetical protein [Henriciella marina]